MVCDACQNTFIKIKEPYCKHCGKPLYSRQVQYCADCEKKKHSYYRQGRALWLYDKKARQAVSRFKYMGRQEYARYFGRQLAKELGEQAVYWNPQALIPVPVHRSRFHKRGYNQAQLLAEEMGKCCGIPVLSDYLLRRKNTKAQKELDSKDRQMNLWKAFSVKPQYKELYTLLKCVIIIDDIYTTGSTVEACAKVLQQAGVEKIYFISLCIGQDEDGTSAV